MARVKGKVPEPTRKEKAAKRMKIVLYIFILATVINGGRMVFNTVAGLVTRSQVVEELGGKEKMAELSKADRQRPYYAYANGRMDRAKTPIGKVFGLLDNIGCLALLWKTCQWGWGVKGTVGFTLAVFYELLFAAVCLPLYFRWKKIVKEKKEEKTVVDAQEAMSRAQEDEMKRMEKEAELEAEKAKKEAWEEQNERIMRQKQTAKWGDRGHR